MNDDFLGELRALPRPAFSRALRERLRRIETTGTARAAWLRPARAWAGSLALLAAGSLALPGVRATARAFLDLFREHSVAAIRFDPSRFEGLRSGNRSPALVLFGEPELLEDPGVPVRHPTPEAAAAAMGLALPLPLRLPAGLALDGVEATSAGLLRLRVDRDALRKTLDELDFEAVKVPRALAEGSLTLRIPRQLTLSFSGTAGWARAVLSESSEPALSPALDLGLLAEIGLRVAGVEADEAQRLARSIDWDTTLLARMPVGAGSFRQVAVGASEGLLVSGAAEGPEAVKRTLVWSSGGRRYVLTGNLGEQGLLELAGGL